ncbi:MAG: hypothetical protein DLM67_02130 [Candidatus Nephthysia bennettiae]|uniref:DUF488 family protein n=1 Tax=Candidatus Nephthysia bennettiae TaxID=3127016 RepID=A0A934K791_9BACT|nr:DUF488 family protein [Candidatus Dormibacteraeota bacterium]MBJ7613635.1 DUF488 family protein [Candidatus Dormibacteraeota bacterium]PZS00160.1 MAG: hypothetical protein DLM67_02130 [Candidatus Dormibacteraeota bacterium]
MTAFASAPEAGPELLRIRLSANGPRARRLPAPSTAWAEKPVPYCSVRRPPGEGDEDHLVELARREPVVLLYGARDPEHNQAVVIRELVEKTP